MKRSINLIIIAFLVITVTESPLAQSTKSGNMSIVLTGDAIITRKLSVYKEPEFLKMIEIIRNADIAFTNLEMLFHDYETYPMHRSGGTYMRGDPQLAHEIKWAGFDMVSTANNHTGDYGVEGMRLTLKYVKEAGLINAGSGESLAEAREAKFLETARGRVALISCASTFPDHSRAGKSRDDIPSRPGLSPLRYTTRYMVTEDHMKKLTDVGKDLGLLHDTLQVSSRVRLWGQNYELADEAEIITEPRNEDMEEIAAVVRNASQLADITIVTIHAHERAGDLSIPAQFLVTFARAMIDAGADIMVGHGPHVLRGIEIYKNKPIFYSLGDFMFQNETLLRLPNENYERYKLDANSHVGDFNNVRYKFDSIGFPSRPKVWGSVIAVPSWQGSDLQSIILYPITLGYGKPRQVRGRPMLADESLGKKIIQDIIDLSKPFGTTIECKKGLGVVQIK